MSIATQDPGQALTCLPYTKVKGVCSFQGKVVSVDASLPSNQLTGLMGRYVGLTAGTVATNVSLREEEHAKLLCPSSFRQDMSVSATFDQFGLFCFVKVETQSQPFVKPLTGTDFSSQHSFISQFATKTQQILQWIVGPGPELSSHDP